MLCLSLLVLSALQDVSVANRMKGLKRRARICRAVELHKYGFTDGCLGCAAAAKGAKPAVGHSETCRQRIETEMAADDIAAARLLRVRKRGGQFHGAVLTAKQVHMGFDGSVFLILIMFMLLAASCSAHFGALGVRWRLEARGILFASQNRP